MELTLQKVEEAAEKVMSFIKNLYSHRLGDYTQFLMSRSWIIWTWDMSGLEICLKTDNLIVIWKYMMFLV